MFRYGTSSQINQSTSESARKKSYRFAQLKKFEKNPSLAVRHINTIPFLPEKILSTRFTVMEFNTQTKLEIRFSHKNVLPAQNITHFDFLSIFQIWSFSSDVNFGFGTGRHLTPKLARSQSF